MKILESTLYQLEIKIDNLGNVFIDTSSVDSDTLRQAINKWHPEYEQTETLCLISREAQRLGVEFRLRLEEALSGYKN